MYWSVGTRCSSPHGGSWAPRGECSASFLILSSYSISFSVLHWFYPFCLHPMRCLSSNSNIFHMWSRWGWYGEGGIGLWDLHPSHSTAVHRWIEMIMHVSPPLFSYPVDTMGVWVERCVMVGMNSLKGFARFRISCLFSSSISLPLIKYLYLSRLYPTECPSLVFHTRHMWPGGEEGIGMISGFHPPLPRSVQRCVRCFPLSILIFHKDVVWGSMSQRPDASWRSLWSCLEAWWRNLSISGEGMFYFHFEVTQEALIAETAASTGHIFLLSMSTVIADEERGCFW